MLLADPEVGDQSLGVFIEPHDGEQLAGTSEGAVPIDDAEAGRLVAEEDVLGDRQERHERQFLVDDDDSEVFAFPDIAELDGLALVDDVSRVAPMRVDAAQHFHQRRLTGTVLAADRVDLAGLNREVHVVERFDARKRLGDPPHFQDRAHGVPCRAGRSAPLREINADRAPHAI